MNTPDFGRILLLATLLISCAAPAASTARPAKGEGTFVIPTQLANGRVELAILPHYILGETVRIPVTIATARGTITGPIAARVLASGINEGKSPAEVPVRSLAASPVTTAAGERRTTSVSWDGLDERGTLVPADAYSLVLEFRLEDGGAATIGRAGVTVQMNAP
jgi:hypothetical protein